MTFNGDDGDRRRQRRDISARARPASLYAGRIGFGVISAIASSTAASLVFATTISVFALVALPVRHQISPVRGPIESAAALSMRKRRAGVRAAFCLNIQKC